MNEGQIDALLSCQLVVAAVLLKYAARVLFSNGCGFRSVANDSAELRQRLFFLCEHILFSIAGYYVIIHLPNGSSWYFYPQLCWVYPPSLPSVPFHLFYIAKLGTHVEDVLFRVSEMNANRRKQLAASTTAATGSIGTQSPTSSEKGERADVMMDVHHFATAALCILSYSSGYYLIGSLLMLVHDVSDIPLDLLKVFMALDWEILMYISYAATLVAWAYFRIWILSAVILRSVIFGPTTSFIFPCEGRWANPQCATGFYAEMGVYVTLIGALWVLHLLWFRKMLLKGYRLLYGGGGGAAVSGHAGSR